MRFGGGVLGSYWFMQFLVLMYLGAPLACYGVRGNEGEKIMIFFTCEDGERVKKEKN